MHDLYIHNVAFFFCTANVGNSTFSEDKTDQLMGSVLASKAGIFVVRGK